MGFENKRFTNCWGQVSDKNSISAHLSIMFGNFAEKCSPSYIHDAVDGNNTRLDERIVKNTLL